MGGLLEAPLVEEVVDRGIGHFLGTLEATLNLLFSVWICQFLPIPLVAGDDILTYLADIWTSFHSMKIWSPPVLFGFFGKLVTEKLLFLPRVYLDEALQKSADKQTNSIDPRPTGELPKDHLSAHFQKKVLEKVGRSDRRRFHRMILWYTRWKGAHSFGLAHAMGPFQKILGTTLSSLFVESRLALCRRTLWGAIGAHMSYNFLVEVQGIIILVGLRFVLSA